jgi:hypothetical protein
MDNHVSMIVQCLDGTDQREGHDQYNKDSLYGEDCGDLSRSMARL